MFSVPIPSPSVSRSPSVFLPAMLQHSVVRPYRYARRHECCRAGNRCGRAGGCEDASSHPWQSSPLFPLCLCESRLRDSLPRACWGGNPVLDPVFVPGLSLRPRPCSLSVSRSPSVFARMRLRIRGNPVPSASLPRPHILHCTHVPPPNAPKNRKASLRLEITRSSALSIVFGVMVTVSIE